MENFVTLTNDNIETEHICCAISDKKCQVGYTLKKEWLKKEIGNGYVFYRLDARAKVFIEYGPAEYGWSPILADNFLLVNCFWVSGMYKKQGYGKALLNHALEDAQSQGKDGLVTIVGKKKFHFMSDTKWLLKQGFEICDELPNGFCLLVKKINQSANSPQFKGSVKVKDAIPNNGLVVYYSNRCPYTEYYVNNVLNKTAENLKIPLKINKIESMEDAQSAPTPATIFSLFLNGQFLTTDLGTCIEARLEKLIK